MPRISRRRAQSEPRNVIAGRRLIMSNRARSETPFWINEDHHFGVRKPIPLIRSKKIPGKSHERIVLGKEIRTISDFCNLPKYKLLKSSTERMNAVRICFLVIMRCLYAKCHGHKEDGSGGWDYSYRINLLCLSEAEYLDSADNIDDSQAYTFFPIFRQRILTIRPTKIVFRSSELTNLITTFSIVIHEISHCSQAVDFKEYSKDEDNCHTGLFWSIYDVISDRVKGVTGWTPKVNKKERPRYVSRAALSKKNSKKNSNSTRNLQERFKSSQLDEIFKVEEV